MGNIAVTTYLRSTSGAFVGLHTPEAVPGNLGKGPYLEGAVEITAHGKTALGRDMWGEVEFMWWGLADMLTEFVTKDAGRMNLPDLPTSVTLTRREGPWLQLEVVTWQGTVLSGSSAHETEFLSEVRSAGQVALPRLLELKPTNLRNHETALAKLHALESPEAN